jgi:adenylate cyclase
MHWVWGRSKREQRRRRGSLLAIGAGLLFAAWALTLGPLHFLQNTIADALFVEGQGSDNVVIVAIDDDTLDQYGRLREWSRSLHATTIQRLDEAGARVIVYDVLFADESKEDEALAQAISAAGNVVVPAAGVTPTESDPVYVYDTFAFPVESVQQAAAVLAHANIVSDSDGRVRRVPLAIRDANGEELPAMSLAALYLQFGRQPPPVLETDGDSLPVLGRTIPLEDHQTMRIHYVGGQESFAVIPFTDVIEDDFDASLIQGKAVLVGMTAAGIDIHAAPLIGSAAGVEILANSLDTLFRAQFLHAERGLVTLVTALAMVGVAAFAIPRWRPTYAVAVVLFLGIAYVVFAGFMFYQGYILDFVDAPAALVVATVVGLIYRALAERAAQQDVGDLFGRYVSKEVAQELVRRADFGELQLGGELREVTTMFADIRGFTGLSEKTEPKELVELLNRQFGVIVSEILKGGGIVNKFGGDAVMAFWNAPQDQPDHALMACRSAIDALAELDGLASGDTEVRFGFGINTGWVVAGNVGAAGRLEYTVIGEAVNTAARLGGASGGEVWVGEETLRQIDGRIEAEALEPQHFKGMAAPITIYRLKRDVPEPLREVAEVLA